MKEIIEILSLAQGLVVGVQGRLNMQIVAGGAVVGMLQNFRDGFEKEKVVSSRNWEQLLQIGSWQTSQFRFALG